MQPGPAALQVLSAVLRSNCPCPQPAQSLPVCPLPSGFGTAGLSGASSLAFGFSGRPGVNSALGGDSSLPVTITMAAAMTINAATQDFARIHHFT